MDNTSILEDVLMKCSESANLSKKYANFVVSDIRKLSNEITEKIDPCINTLTENFKADDMNQIFIKQIIQFRNEISILPDKLEYGVKSISDDVINITLFGRTMAGKSTLMEILTHGDGKSIGTGYQRTTRDVREYNYKGMVITDVPGIAAFGGESDTEIAFEAAKKADLILFLITDDAPQPSEAECLQRVLSLGKPVLCLINIIADINKGSSLKLFERDLEKKMNENHIYAIKQQFLEFGAAYGQDWSMLQFEYVHLKAAFLSQQAEFSESRSMLYKLSRFNIVEHFIIQEIVRNGRFYKFKSYIDILSVPIVATADILLQQHAGNIEQNHTFTEKKNNIISWLDEFKIKGKNQIKKSLDTLKATIRKDIPDFAETHYDDKRAGDKWVEKLKKQKIKEQCDEILNALFSECSEKFNEVYREINAELRFNYHVFSENNIEMPQIINHKSIWNWGVTLVSGGLIVSAFFVPVLSLAAVGVAVIGTFISGLFKSKEKKIAEARQKLENQLNNELDKQFEKIEKELNNIFDNTLIQNNVYPIITNFNTSISFIEALYQVQSGLSNILYNKHEVLNRTLIYVISELYSENSIKPTEFLNIARRAGNCLALVSQQIMTQHDISLISNILHEKVYWIPYSSNKLEMALFTTGLNTNELSAQCCSLQIERFIINKKELDPSTINRIKLSQQITRIYITK